MWTSRQIRELWRISSVSMMMDRELDSQRKVTPSFPMRNPARVQVYFLQHHTVRGQGGPRLKQSSLASSLHLWSPQVRSTEERILVCRWYGTCGQKQHVGARNVVPCFLTSSFLTLPNPLPWSEFHTLQAISGWDGGYRILENSYSLLICSQTVFYGMPGCNFVTQDNYKNDLISQNFTYI